MLRRRSRIAKDERGTAVIEFALVAPLMMMVLMGITAYGQYFWMAHGLQQAANDGARASIAGLTAAERRTLSQAAVQNELAQLGGISSAQAATLVEDNGTTVSVAISYDASRNPLMRMSMLPLPSSIISRRASVQIGGL